MTLTFISNYINHHQIPLSNCFYEVLGGDYYFIQTQPMARERKDMGWGAEQGEIPYLVCSYEQPELTRQLLFESDVVIFGGCEDEELIQPRLLSGKLTFRYSERIYKEGQWKWVSPRGIRKKYHDHIRFRKAPLYLLCAGAYVASDFHLIHAYPGKMFSFGYFPECKRYQEDDCHSKRRDHEVPVILWAGRFIPYKHPELAVLLMKELKAENLNCELRMVGGGELEGQLKELARREGVEDCIRFLGFMEPGKVREQMELADLFLFTSDYGEGWGAVLNESMNSGCAVVACRAIGAVPDLIRDGKNGFVYRNGDFDTMKKHVKTLLNDREMRLTMGRRAYETIRDTWNPETAAERLLAVMAQIEELRKENENRRGKAPLTGDLQLPWEGPLSPAKVLSPGLWNQKI